MPIDAFKKTGNPKDGGSQFLTKKEKAAIAKAEAEGLEKLSKSKKSKETPKVKTPEKED